MISRYAEGSEPRRTGPAAAWRALGLFALAAGLGLSAPVVRGAAPARIAAITMLVDGRPAGPGLEKLTSLKIGGVYSPYAVSEAIKQAFGTGLYSDVRVFAGGGEEVELTFELTSRPLIRSVHIRGLRVLSSSRIRNSLVSLRTDVYFDQDRLRPAVAEIEAALAREGYFQPRVRPTVFADPQAPEVEVTFDVSVGPRYIISDIRFEGGRQIPAKDLRKLMKTRVGAPYALAKLERDLQRIRDKFRAAGFPRAAVEPAPESFFVEEGTVSLLIKIDTGERVDIAISGAKVPVNLLQPIWEAPIFEDWGMSEGEARILGYLRGKNYIFASVRSSIDKIEDGLRVNHVVSPGKKYNITGIQFEGNTNLTAEQIRRQLMLADRERLFGGIDGKMVFELPDQIEVLYQTRGFADVQVNLHFHESEAAAVAAFGIEEGPQRRVRKIEFLGAGLVDEPTLREVIALQEGGPYFGPSVERDIRVLESFYLDRGVRGTAIEARSTPAGEDEFDVSFLIREGKSTKIQGIFISGNLVTRDTTVLRELRTGEGEVASLADITATRAGLEKLAVFSEVRLDEVPLGPGLENLVVRLREGERNYVGLGLGLETRNELQTSSITSAQLRPRATAEYMRSNVFGTAASLSLVSQFSLAEKRLIASWEQPYFLFGLRVPTYLNGWIEEEDRTSFGYRREGVSLSVITQIFWDLRLLAALRYASTTLSFLNFPANEVDREFFPYSATSVEPSFIREKRDDPFNPTRGYFSSLSFQYAFPAFATESDFLKLAFKYQRYYSPVRRLVLSGTFRLGLGQGRMPIHERFFAGGSNSFRGQEFDELGPKDPVSGMPVGGKAMGLFNFEAVFPILSSIRDLGGVLFYDLGNVFANRNDLHVEDFEHAVGLGLRYRTPLGPIRFELGWNLTDPEKKGEPIVYVTIGNIF